VISNSGDIMGIIKKIIPFSKNNIDEKYNNNINIFEDLSEKIYIYCSDKLITYNDLMIRDNNVLNICKIIDVSLLNDLISYKLMFFGNGILIIFKVKYDSKLDEEFENIVDILSSYNNKKFVCSISSNISIDLNDKSVLNDISDIVEHCLFGNDTAIKSK